MTVMLTCVKQLAAMKIGGFMMGVLLVSLLLGCARTVSEHGAIVKQPETGDAAATGFFGEDLSLLHPGAGAQEAMVYVNPNAHWSNYNRIMLEPVQFWDGANSSVSPTDQHMLTAYFYNQLKTDLESNFTLVDEGGSGVLVLQVALLNANAATRDCVRISLVVSQLRVGNAANRWPPGVMPSLVPPRLR
jgi:hypothetical protein